MKKTSCKFSGILTSKGASVLFFGFHSIFAIFDPSGTTCRRRGCRPYRRRSSSDCHHYFEQRVSLTHRDDLPVFVRLEVRERQPVGNLQRVLVLSSGCPTAHRDQYHSKDTRCYGEPGAANTRRTSLEHNYLLFSSAFSFNTGLRFREALRSREPVRPRRSGRRQ